MECWDGGESDTGLEEGALKGSLFIPVGMYSSCEEGSVHTYVHTHSSREIYSGHLATNALVS